MKKLFAKIMNSKNNTSLRTQITGTILLSILLILFTILATTKLVLRTMDLTGNSYQTNADLDAYLKLIENTEASLESYIKFRTFEGIDKYYHYESAAQAKVLFFNEKSSNIPISQKKYIIRRLSESFFRFGDKAVDARRANNHKDTNYYMEKALQCYSFLTDEISSLTMLYFQTNAAQYESSKTYTKNLLQFSIFFMFTILIAAFFLLFIRITHIIQPLSSISAVAHKLADRDFNVPLFNNQSKNEIGHICRAFDCMIISIREYVDTIWEKALKENQLREKEIEMQALYSDARLKALQNQIKPHFLFNTLNTGAQLAMIEGADKTCYFLEQVADFFHVDITFRYNQHTDRSATIQEELGMLDNYIYIMQTRFGDRFTFEKYIQKNLLNTKVPNMILQPLVENCIKHGLKDKIKGGIIEIKVAESENEIEISISDNGCGFHPEIKEQIFQAVKAGAGTIIKDMKDEEKEHHSTGLLNVISRPKLYYKKDNILQILSNPKGEGTMFLIRIPNV